MPLFPPQDYRKTFYTHRRGTRANQPAATDVLPGTLYYVTDEGVTEWSDGSAWQTYTDTGGGGGITNIRVSAGTTSNLLSALTFSDANGVSFGLNASTITASVAGGGGGLTNINVSAGTTSQNLSNLVFSNSNNVSFGLNGSTITATATISSSQDSINVSAGTTSNNLSALTFSNSPTVTFGLDGSTITASAAGGAGAALQSFWANYPMWPPGNVTVTGGTIAGTAIHYFPMMLPYPLTGSYLRQVYSISLSTQTLETSANTSFTMTGQSRFGYVIFTLGNGGSSNSLMSLYSNANTVTSSLSFTANANGSEYSFTQGVTFPLFGGTITTSQSTDRTSSNINVGFLFSNILTGIRFIDIPWNTSLPAGAYWVGLGRFSSINNGGPSGLTSNNMIIRTAGWSASQEFAGVRPPLFTATNPILLGQGDVTQAGQVLTTSAIPLTSITQRFIYSLIQVAMVDDHIT
jgi:hypothetical protein